MLKKITMKDIQSFSLVQQRFIALVKRGVSFRQKGQSLIYRGEVFPVEMARALGLWNDGILKIK